MKHILAAIKKLSEKDLIGEEVSSRSIEESKNL